MSDGVLVGRMYRPQDTRPKGAVAKLGEEVIWGGVLSGIEAFAKAPDKFGIDQSKASERRV